MRSKIIATAAILATAMPAYADGPTILRLIPGEAESSTENIVSVDRHEVLLLDVSLSMNRNDFEASLRGVVNHYASEKALADYNSGICTANTLVLYADMAYVMDTQIICGPDDLQRFIAEIDSVSLWGVRFFRAGFNTSLTNAMLAATSVFQEEQSLGIMAGQHSVIIMGDQLGGDSHDLRGLSVSLTASFGATVSAISINNTELASIFSGVVSTSEENAQLYYTRAGMTEAATNPEEVQSMLQKILRLNQG